MSSKSLFSIPGIQKMISHGILTTWNIASWTSRKSFISRSEGKLWVFRAFRLLKISLKRLHESHFLRFPDSGNKFEWPIDNLKHRFIDIVIVDIRRPESRLWFLRAIRLLKTSLTTSYKLLFWMARMQKMFPHCFSTPWNIASLTSPKSFFYVQKADYEFSGPFAYIDHHLSDFIQVTFFRFPWCIKWVR
jgi:hypothetical protein